jgi:hypothetical protein
MVTLVGKRGKSSAPRPERPASCLAAAVSNLAAATVTFRLSADHERPESYRATLSPPDADSNPNLKFAGSEGSELITSAVGTNHRFEVGHSVSAAPGCFRHQLVPLLFRKVNQKAFMAAASRITNLLTRLLSRERFPRPGFDFLNRRIQLKSHASPRFPIWPLGYNRSRFPETEIAR